MPSSEPPTAIVPASGPAGQFVPLPAAGTTLLQQTPDAAFAVDEFFRATLGHPHTRRAYGRTVGCFLA